MTSHWPVTIWVVFRFVIFLFAFGKFYKEEDYGTIVALVGFNIFEVGLLAWGGLFR